MEVKTEPSEYKYYQQPIDYLSSPEYLRAFKNHMLIQGLRKDSEKLREKSFTDSLTGCYNRNAWEDYQNHFDLIRGDRITLIAIDVNGLKMTNDTKGHDAGDKLIKDTASYLQEVFYRKGDRVYRIGGDEFVVTCEYIASNKRGKFNSFINLHLSQENLKPKGLDFAIGVSHSNPKEDISIKDTLKRADTAMYHDKLIRKAQKPYLYSR